MEGSKPNHITPKENPMSKDIVYLFCDLDDFCQVFEPQMKRRLLADGTIKRQKKSRLAPTWFLSRITSAINGVYTGYCHHGQGLMDQGHLMKIIGVKYHAP